MPTNVVQGQTVTFTVEFLDASGNLTVPSSGTLVVTYPLVGGGTSASSIALTPSGAFFFTGNWGSSVSALGLANWSVSAPGLLINPAATGQILVIDP